MDLTVHKRKPIYIDMNSIRLQLMVFAVDTITSNVLEKDL